MRAKRTLAALMAATLITASYIQAATFNVTTTADEVGGPGLSLREAIDGANSDNENSTIVLQPGTYQLTLCGTFDDANATGDLDHTEAFDLVIEGNGATIENTCAGDRILHNHAGGSHVTLENVTITGGHVSLTEFGGGVWMDAGDLTVTSSTIIGNEAGESGGGIQVDYGDLTITDSVIENNESGLPGGGVEVGGPVTVVILDSVFHGNDGDIGGGISVGSAASLTIERTTFTMNSSPDGSAAYFGQIDSGIIEDCAFENNSGGHTIRYNDLRDPVGSTPHLVLRRCTVADNVLAPGLAAVSINTDNRILRVENSTVSNNFGIGVAASNHGIIDLVHSTVVSNEEHNVSALGFGEFRTFGSIIADVDAGGTDCALAVGAQSRGYNFAGDGTCGLGLGSDDVSFGGDPKLAPLANNGGYTRTRAPYADSPVVDHVQLAACTGELGGGATDQRGAARPDGADCDVGAYEGHLLVNAPAIVIVVWDGSVRPVKIITCLTKLGLTVELVRGEEASSTHRFRSAAGIVIAATVDPSRFSPDWKSLAVPLLVMQPGLFDDLGMTGKLRGSYGVTDGLGLQELDIVGRGSLAAGLKGRVRVVERLSPFNFGIPFPSAQVIARLPKDEERAAIFSYERGDGLDGFRAPAARIGFFATERALNSLSEDGERLFAAAALEVAGAALPAKFRRGDVDGDGQVILADAFRLVGGLFGGRPLDCFDAADANDDGSVNFTDAITLARYVLLGTASIPAPGPNVCGADPTTDELDCAAYEVCDSI